MGKSIYIYNDTQGLRHGRGEAAGPGPTTLQKWGVVLPPELHDVEDITSLA